MKILYIHQYFKTPEEGGAIRSYYLAKGLVEHGHEVEMITSWSGKKYKRENKEGIKVHYLPVAYSSYMGFVGRVVSFLRFFWQAYRWSLKFPDADICYATSTPLTVGLSAYLLKRKTGIPYHFEVRDLWPEAPIQLGILRNPILIWLARKLERIIYQEAKSIVALSPGIKLSIEKMHPQKPIRIISNIADCDFFSPDPVLHKSDQAFIISYIGACGPVNQLESFIEIAIKSKEAHLPIEFHIMADGPSLKSIEQMASSNHLEQVIFHPFGNKESVRDLMSKTHAVFVCFSQECILQTNSPNKFFDGLAATKLIIVNVQGWLAEMVREHQLGFYVNPHFPEECIEKLHDYLHNFHLLQQGQLNARLLAEQYFSIDIQVHRLMSVLEEKSTTKDLEVRYKGSQSA